MNAELTKPFPTSRHKWRVLNVSQKINKATWYVYVDARDVAERLDQAGVAWSDDYEIVSLTDSLCVVQCRLTIEGQTRTDVGSDTKNKMDSEGNYIKGAYSDALKRAAVKFGIGRYLYRLTSYYLPIDEFKRFTPDSETKIKQHLIKELTKLGAEKDAEPQADDDVTLTSLDDTPELDPDPQMPKRSPAFIRFQDAGKAIYGQHWDKTERHALIQRYTKENTPENVRSSNDDLSDDECDILADYLTKNHRRLAAGWKARLAKMEQPDAKVKQPAAEPA